MDHYVDILIKPDSKMRENVLLNEVFAKFHKALCEMDVSDIGVSFPEYKIRLGRKLRVHSSKSRLEQLQAKLWLGELANYCKQSAILTVPLEVNLYRVISRIQQNMTNAKLRRLIKRGAINTGDIKKYKSKMYAGGLSEAYLELESSSNGYKYRRYISFSENKLKPVFASFDSFGLSNGATVPWF